MRIKNLIFFTLIPTALSEVTFNLIVPVGTPSVIVDNKSYKMEVKEYPVYQVKVKSAKAPVHYCYSIDYSGTDYSSKGVVREQIDRVLNSGDETLNEFFDRSITVKEHPALPKAYPSFERYSPSKLYDDTHVATVIIKMNPADIARLHKDPTSEEKIRQIEFIYASPYSVRTFKNATFSISGQSTRYAAKLSYGISNLKGDKNKELFKRTGIKLRAEHMDPSYIRDKIYADMLNSLGVPTPQNKFARVFINGEPMGLFDLSDTVSNHRYLRETLNNGSKFDVENPLFKADYFPPSAYGDLGYYGAEPDNPKYSIYYYKGKSIEDVDEDRAYQISTAVNKQYLIPFLQDISQYPNKKSLNLDIDMFLKFMAMQFLGGSLDNYWSRPGNYFLYKNMNYNGGQWLFLDSDYHYTFGIGGDKFNEYIKVDIDGYAALNDEIDPARPLLDNIRKDEEKEIFFKDVFKRLIETAFHVDAIFPRIDSIVELIREDVAWDLSLPRMSGYPDAEDFHFTLDDFNDQVTNDSTGCENLTDLMPIKCWIRHRGKNTAAQLGFDYPKSPDRSLGDVPTLVQSDKSAATKTKISMTSIAIICVLFALLF